MATAANDGPLKMLLRRFSDRPARLHVQRWKPDHPVTISLTLEELDEIESGIALVRQQLALAPNSAGGLSSLDIGEMVRLNK